jgi:hypothetical protein
MLPKNFSAKPITRALLGIAASVAFASTATAANIVTNPGFEDPSTAPGVEYFGATGWNAFGGGTFTVNSAVEPNPYLGDQVLKVFGGTSGVFQTFAANPGDLVTGTAWAMNSSADLMTGGQVAAVNLSWFDSSNIKIADSFGSTIDANAPIDVWTNIGVVGAIAPAGTASVQLTLITGNFAGDPAGGAPRFDEAFLEVSAVPVPAAVWLFGSGLIGLIGIARRRRSS